MLPGVTLSSCLYFELKYIIFVRIWTPPIPSACTPALLLSCTIPRDSFLSLMMIFIFSFAIRCKSMKRDNIYGTFVERIGLGGKTKVLFPYFELSPLAYNATKLVNRFY